MTTHECILFWCLHAVLVVSGIMHNVHVMLEAQHAHGASMSVLLVYIILVRPSYNMSVLLVYIILVRPS
jgi:hypothetical protein